MKLEIRRKWLGTEATLGELYVDGVFECFTLEDVVRHGDIMTVKIPGRTAIPAGQYRVIVDHSQRFDRDLPHVLDVPGFTGIRIHPGNTAADTEGCILVGTHRTADSVLESRKAFEALLSKIQAGLGAGCTLVIVEEAPPDVLRA